MKTIFDFIVAVIGHIIWYIPESMIVSNIWQNQFYAVRVNTSVVKILALLTNGTFQLQPLIQEMLLVYLVSLSHQENEWYDSMHLNDGIMFVFALW